MDKKKDKLLQVYQAALKIFARYGYRRARIEDIADELGMRKGSLYNYIETKKELYEETIVYALIEWQAAARKISDKIMDPSEQLATYAINGLSYLLKNDDLRKIIADDPSIFPTAKKQDRFSMLNQASIDIVESIIQRGIDERCFCKINAKQAAETLYSIYIFYINKINMDSNDKSSLKNFKDVLPIFFNGLLIRG